MATRAVQMIVEYTAWDVVNQTPKTGDVANHTLSWIKDGTRSAPSNAAAEVDSTNAPGEYKLTLTSTETDCLFGTLAGKSSTANIVLIPTRIGFDDIAAIKTQTDKMTFTVTNKMDSNVLYVNGHAVTGDGHTGTEWGPA